MNWKQTLAAVAPSLAGAIGGPLAFSAVKRIGQVLIGDEFDGDESDIETAIMGASPEQLLALKNADNTFKVQMKKLDVGNTQGARKLAIDTSILPQVALSIIYTLGYFYLIYGLGSGEITIPEKVAQPFNILLGIMTGAQAQIMNFWFGSSSGSKEKTSKLK